jgi:DNA-binding MarR family transcriptional regulator
MSSDLFERLQDEIKARDDMGGLSPIDLLDMPESVAVIVNAIVRNNGLQRTKIAELVNLPEKQIQELLDDLVDKGFVRKVQVQDKTWYKAHFKRKAESGNRTGIWSILDEIT